MCRFFLRRQNHHLLFLAESDVLPRKVCGNFAINLASQPEKVSSTLHFPFPNQNRSYPYFFYPFHDQPQESMAMRDFYSDKDVKCVYCYKKVFLHSDFPDSLILRRYVTPGNQIIVNVDQVSLDPRERYKDWCSVLELRNVFSRMVVSREQQPSPSRERLLGGFRDKHMYHLLSCPNCNCELGEVEVQVHEVPNRTLLSVALDFSSSDYSETVTLSNVRVDPCPSYDRYGCRLPKNSNR